MKDYYGWLKEQELQKKNEKVSSLKREDREKKWQKIEKGERKRKKKNKQTRCSIEHLVFASFFYLKSDILFIFFLICSKIL